MGELQRIGRNGLGPQSYTKALMTLVPTVCQGLKNTLVLPLEYQVPPQVCVFEHWVPCWWYYFVML